VLFVYGLLPKSLLALAKTFLIPACRRASSPAFSGISKIDGQKCFNDRSKCFGQQPGILPRSQRPPEALSVSIFDAKLISQDDTIDSSVALAAGCKAPGCLARKKTPRPLNYSIFNGHS
jgi:hypothetical protein